MVLEQPQSAPLWQKYHNSARNQQHCHLSITLIMKEVHRRKTKVATSKGRQSLKVKKQITVLAYSYDGAGGEGGQKVNCRFQGNKEILLQ